MSPPAVRKWLKEKNNRGLATSDNIYLYIYIYIIHIVGARRRSGGGKNGVLDINMPTPWYNVRRYFVVFFVVVNEDEIMGHAGTTRFCHDGRSFFF